MKEESLRKYQGWVKSFNVLLIIDSLINFELIIPSENTEASIICANYKRKSWKEVLTKQTKLKLKN